MSPRSNTARRVVTGIDEDGKSCVWLDGDVHDSAVIDNKIGRKIARGIWAIEQVPTSIIDGYDPMENWFPDHPWVPEVGLHFDLFTWQPGSGFDMHATESLDIGVIISGHVALILEKETAVLGPGDCFVQRGTQHGWKVVGDEPCTLVAVLIAKKQEAS